MLARNSSEARRPAHVVRQVAGVRVALADALDLPEQHGHARSPQWMGTDRMWAPVRRLLSQDSLWKGARAARQPRVFFGASALVLLIVQWYTHPLGRPPQH